MPFKRGMDGSHADLWLWTVLASASSVARPPWWQTDGSRCHPQPSHPGLNHSHVIQMPSSAGEEIVSALPHVSEHKRRQLLLVLSFV